ncbi:MAG: TolC family protein [Syntrophobacteraceae bacterium]
MRRGIVFCLGLAALGFWGCASDGKSPEETVARMALDVPREDSSPDWNPPPVPHDPDPPPAAQEPAVTGRLGLDQAIDEALRASPDLAQIGARIDAATQQVRQAEAAFYPRIVFSEEFNITNNPVFAAMNIINQRRLLASTDFNNPGEQQNFMTRFQGEWVLFQGGSRFYDRGAAVQQKKAVASELQGARNQLVARVTEVYYRWLQALSFIGVAEKAHESAKTDERIGAARLRVEAALPSDLARLKARTAEMEGNLVSARTGARKVQAAMERLLTRPLRDVEVPDPSFEQASLGDLSAMRAREELVKKALDQRPEMAAVRSLVDAAQKRTRSARGGMLPRLATSGQYQWDTQEWSETPNSWLVAVQATWPLFEGGLTMARIKEARARLAEMESKGRQIELDIALEVQQAALSVEEAAEKIRVAEERRKWATKALEEVRHQYDRGAVGVDGLLQSEVAWNQAEVSAMAARFDGMIAQAALRMALGEFSARLDGQSSER